jgi:hypothetical protein
MRMTHELSPLSRVGRFLSSAPSSWLGVVVPWFTDSAVVGLVAKVLGGIEPITEKGSLGDGVILGRNGGSG